MQKTIVLSYTVELSFSPLRLLRICYLWKERIEGRYQKGVLSSCQVLGRARLGAGHLTHEAVET